MNIKQNRVRVLREPVIGRVMNMRLTAFFKLIKFEIEKYKFNYVKTIIANFSLFPFRQAIHFPLVIYNSIELKIRRSKIILETPARFGVITIGRNIDYFISSKNPSLLFMLNASFTVGGNIKISSGVTFRIDGGDLYIGKNCAIGANCKILCNNNISIGEHSIFAYGHILCDTDYHFIEYEGKIKNCNGSIRIGKYVWAGNNSSIAKGSILPDYSVISNKTYVNKDFSNFNDGILVAGTPGKVIKVGLKRVLSLKLEVKLKEYFKSDKSDVEYNMTREELEIHDNSFKKS